jgi:hypothetical protein
MNADRNARLMFEFVVGEFDDGPLKHQASYDLLRGVLERYVTNEVEDSNDKAPALFSVVRSGRSLASL